MKTMVYPGNTFLLEPDSPEFIEYPKPEKWLANVSQIQVAGKGATGPTIGGFPGLVVHGSRKPSGATGAVERGTVTQLIDAVLVGFLGTVPLAFNVQPATANVGLSGNAGSFVIEDGKRVMKQLEDHLHYLRRVSTVGTDPPITQQTADQARKAWWAVWEATTYALPIPAACTGPDGQMLYVWDRGRHHLELEIIPGQPAEFFYRDRETEELWAEDYIVGGPLPAEAVEKLKLFI
jgi:hypothetical protein